jgi:hypothetical protein
VIFIDKFNVSGIEIMTLEGLSQEIASWAGSLAWGDRGSEGTS